MNCRSPLFVASLWGTFNVYLITLHAFAGLEYHGRIPKPKPAPVVKEDKPPTPIPDPLPSPTPSPTPPIPPPTPTASPPAATHTPPPPPPPPHFAVEPEPIAFKHRLIVFLMKTEALNPKDFVTAAVQDVHKEFKADFFRDKMYLVDQDGVTEPWDPARGPMPRGGRSFDKADYDAALREARRAADKLIPAEHRARYALLVIWASPANPDNVLKANLTNSAWNDRTYFAWAARAADNDSQTLRQLFPDRLIRLGRAAELNPGLLRGQILYVLGK